MRRIAAMRRKAAPDDKYSVDYSRFAAIDSSDDDEPTRADAYRSMDFKNLPKPPPSSGKEGFREASSTSCDELAPEPPPPDAERAAACSREKTRPDVPYANDAVPHVPPGQRRRSFGALIDKASPSDGMTTGKVVSSTARRTPGAPGAGSRRPRRRRTPSAR